MVSHTYNNRRTSMNQPVHWRPPYFKTVRSYQAYVNREPDETRSPGSDHGLDNFSYDPEHLKEWQAPAGLVDTLPTELGDVARNWEMAGAALCTAFERTQDLCKEAVDRAYPEASSHSHLTRHISSRGPTIVGPASPPLSSPDSPTLSMPEGAIAIHKIPQMPLPLQTDLGVDSPPMTPFDSFTASTPLHLGGGSKTREPDLALVTTHLSPCSSTESSTPPPSAFDESSWERYLTSFNIQLADDKEAVNRLKGYARQIDMLCSEYGRVKEVKEVIDQFSEWWLTAKPKVSEYDERLHQMHAPSLDDVRLEL